MRFAVALFRSRLLSLFLGEAAARYGQCKALCTSADMWVGRFGAPRVESNPISIGIWRSERHTHRERKREKPKEMSVRHQSDYAGVLSSDEHWIMEAAIFEKDKDDKPKELVLVLSSKALYKVDPAAPGKALQRRDFRDFESAQLGPLSPPTVQLVVAGTGGHSLFGSSKNKGPQLVEFVCAASKARGELHHVLQARIRAAWQVYFETSVIKPPEIYQSHFFITRTAKHSSHARLLTLSDHMLYYSEVKGGNECGKLKWAVPLKTLEALKVGGDGTSFTVFFSEAPEKDEKEFAFQAQSADDRTTIIHELRRVVFHRESQILPLR